MIVSCEASCKFHRTGNFQKDRFVRGFFQILYENGSKTQSFTHPGQRAEQFQELKIAFHHNSVQSTHESYERFIQQNQNARLATPACHPKFRNVRFATAPCAKMQKIQRTTSAATRGIQKSPFYNSYVTFVVFGPTFMAFGLEVILC